MLTARRKLFILLCTIVSMATLLPSFAAQPAQAQAAFVRGINMNGNAVTIDGNSWLSYSDAQNSGFSTTASKTFSNNITWSPAVDANTKAMLDQVIYQSSASFSMTQTIANGDYEVYFWLTENYANGARKEDIKLEGTTVATGVGSMNKNTWVKYGPYAVNVSDGALNMDFVRISGDPQVAGLAIFSSGGPIATNTPTAIQPTNTAVPTRTFTPTRTPTNTATRTFTPTATIPVTGRDGWVKIETESYSSSSGSLQVCSGVLCYIGANASVQYNSVNLHSGTNKIDLNVANGGGNTGIQVWVGGVNLATLTVGGTGGWSTYQTKSLTLPAQSGVKDVKLVFVNGNVNVDWLIFSATGTATPTNTPGPTNTPNPNYNPCPTSGNCKILPLGDSITDGSFNGGNAGAYRIQLFRRTIQANPLQHITFTGPFANGPTTVNGVTFPRNHAGVIGEQISSISARLDPSNANYAMNEIPHIVLVMGGTNNVLWNKGSLTTAPDQLGALIDKIFNRAPNALVVVAKLTPLTGSHASEDGYVQSFNNALSSIVNARVAQGKHVILIDMHVLSASEIADGIHPTAAGYAHMGDIWYTAISQYLH